MDLKDTFIGNLKKYRKARGMSQMRLADLLDSSTGYIGQIEIGVRFPSIDMIQKMAEVLQIKPHLLFLDADESASAVKTLARLPRQGGLSDKEREDLIKRLCGAISKVVRKQ